VLAACGPAGEQPAELAAGLPLVNCALAAPGGLAGVDAECGTLAVPEDRSDPAGRAISLKLAVVRAVSRSPQPDALFVLAGGPGQAVTEVYPAIAPAFDRVTQTRDIVLVDQRGTGGSGALECGLPETNAEALALPLDEQIARLQDCPARLGVDPDHYTTLDFVHDLDAARAALGYEQVDLYGASYGTRAALVYLREYPERVRALVLDAVVSPGMVLFAESSRDGQRALDLTLERCRADMDCRAAFPELQAELEDLLARLEQAPLPLTLPDPATAELLEFELSRETFVSVLFNLLYVPEAVSLMPLAVHQAAAGGDFGPLFGLALDFDAGLYDGLFYSVACAEDAPYAGGPPAAADGIYFGDMGAPFREVCAAWPSEPAGDDVRESFTSPVPALLLSGEADPITPPGQAEAAAEFLPNSLHLVAPGMGHGILVRGCIPRLVAEFIEDASTAALQTDCVTRIQPPPFFLRPTGPNP
jgi:pimeloyl-ACP methyl ester carboxylesterase